MNNYWRHISSIHNYGDLDNGGGYKGKIPDSIGNLSKLKILYVTTLCFYFLIISFTV